jgi:two-component system phosphate regulon sensor histidine kinase PhoR
VKPLLRLAFAIGAVPLLLLGLLMLTQELRPLPGLAGCAAVMLASLALAWGWRARLALLAVSLGEALAQIRVAPARAEATALPSTDDLADGIRRLARGLAEQGALLERLRRADAAILENLPEPVLLLSAERAVLRANPAARAMLGPEAAGQGPDAAALILCWLRPWMMRWPKAIPLRLSSICLCRCRVRFRPVSCLLIRRWLMAGGC